MKKMTSIFCLVLTLCAAHVSAQDQTSKPTKPRFTSSSLYRIDTKIGEKQYTGSFEVNATTITINMEIAQEVDEVTNFNDKEMRIVSQGTRIKAVISRSGEIISQAWFVFGKTKEGMGLSNNWKKGPPVAKFVEPIKELIADQVPSAYTALYGELPVKLPMTHVAVTTDPKVPQKLKAKYIEAAISNDNPQAGVSGNVPYGFYLKDGINQGCKVTVVVGLEKDKTVTKIFNVPEQKELINTLHLGLEGKELRLFVNKTSIGIKPGT